MFRFFLDLNETCSRTSVHDPLAFSKPGILGTSLSAVVKHDQEVKGSNPVENWAFFSLYLLNVSL